MFTKITTIAALSTFVACSSPFEVNDSDDQKVPSAENVRSGDIEEVAIDDQVGLELANVDGPVFDKVDDAAMAVMAPDLNDSHERLSSQFENADPVYELSALLVKRVDEMMDIRVYPAAKSFVEICLQGHFGNDCFRGQARPFEQGLGGEFSIEMGSYEMARTYTIEMIGHEDAFFGPFDMPAEDNYWNEVSSCESELEIDSFSYDVYQAGNTHIGHVKYYSHTPTSALLCGVDEAGDKGCVWDEVSEGKKQLKVRLNADLRTPDVLLRDEKGCSVSYGPS